MPRRVLGLDIGEDSVTGVEIESGLKGHNISACARIMIESVGGEAVALERLFDQFGSGSDITVASIPGRYASYRNILMPFKDPKKIGQAVAFEIEAMVPFPIEDLLVDFTIIDRSEQSEILAVSVQKEYVSEYLSHMERRGIDPDILDVGCSSMVLRLLKKEGMPDQGLFLDMGGNRIKMVLFDKGRVVLIRTLGSNHGPEEALTAQGTEATGDKSGYPGRIEDPLRSSCAMIMNTIHALEWQRGKTLHPEKIFFTGAEAIHPETENLLSRFLGIPAERIDLARDQRIHMAEDVSRIWNPLVMDGALALALRGVGGVQGFNVRRDEYEKRKDYFGLKREVRKAALVFTVVMSLVVADAGLHYYFLKQRSGVLDREIAEVFRKTFPDAKKIVDPARQMKVKINEIKGPAMSAPGMKPRMGALDLLRDISERIPKSLNVHVTRMVIDPETVRISGTTDTFNTVDAIKNGLEPTGSFGAVTISSATIDRLEKQVQFEIKAQLKQ